MKHHSSRKRNQLPAHQTGLSRRAFAILLAGSALALLAFYLLIRTPPPGPQSPAPTPADDAKSAPPPGYNNIWLRRAYAVDQLFHAVYTPCWEGAYGAIGDAYLFAATDDSSLLRFNLIDHNLTHMCEGTWVDDRAWVCLAELEWWRVTGKKDNGLVEDASRRYLDARNEGRLSDYEGFWAWYNYPPARGGRIKIFTNSNMNQMVAVACGLFEATHDQQFLREALRVWNGDSEHPGIEKMLYRGKGMWEGRPGLAAFGKEIPWDGADYASIAAALYSVTQDPKYKRIVVETVRRVMNPASGWVDSTDFYQIRMDGNGAFVNFLLNAYAIAPDELSDIPGKIGKMLDHVWSNHDGAARVMLHRETDDGIRNGWNPLGGEDGYNVNEVGTVHAQGEAARAFGVYAYYTSKHQ